MKLIPINGYVDIVEVSDEPDDGKGSTMTWSKKQGELTVVRIHSGVSAGTLAVVITSTIQRFEFKGKSFSIVPTSGLIGYLE